MTGYTPRDKLLYWLIRDRVPVTKLLMLSNAVTFLLMQLFRLVELPRYLAYSSGSVTSAPWTLLTYSILGACGGLLCMIFSLYWLWLAGGSLERSWGSRGFAAFFFLMSAISALGLLAGGLALGIGTGAAGLWLPLAGMTVAFAMLNPEQEILFFLIIPLKLKYLALIDVAAVLINYGRIHPVLGLFALAGCVYSYWKVNPRAFGARRRAARGRIIRVHEKPSSLSRLNPSHRARELRERKRLKDLFDKSDE